MIFGERKTSLMNVMILILEVFLLSHFCKYMCGWILYIKIQSPKTFRL